MMMEQLGKFEKKEKPLMRDDLNHDEKQKVGKDNNKRKKESIIILITMEKNN